MRSSIPISLLGIVLPLSAWAQGSFVNWENAPVHPLEKTPDSSRLLAANLADNRLEIFDITSGTPRHVGAIPVGLDPVSVRARTATEIWVVNHISDSVSIVSLATMNVVATLRTDDEPCGVVFAGTPQRAFVSCSQANAVLVFDPANLATAPTRINIVGEDPRSMAVSADGSEVYVAVFESGNRSTILAGGAEDGTIGFPPNAVNNTASPYFNSQQPFQLGVNPPNPPPNNGASFSPPINPAVGTPPRVGMIVKKNAAGQWMDDNNHDWTHMVSGPQAATSGRPVGWDLWDHDVAIISASTLTVSRYATGVTNLCMSLAVNPASGQITVIGTDATNEIRFEPVVQGRFIRVEMGRVDPATPTTLGRTDLNPHIVSHYGTTIPFESIPQDQREQSLGDPRGIVWNAAGTIGYVSGMGSNNVIVIDANGNRIGANPTIHVGEGPTGMVLDETRGRLYVLNRFEATISVVNTATESELFPRAALYDPTPAAIRDGRHVLYNTHENSGLGHIACASCHVDARMDRLAWDLGDPSGLMKVFNQNCNAGLPLGPACEDWHPMKGPMTTQTLQDIIGKEPHHWRGDRDGIEEFAQAFAGLQGSDEPLSPADMQDFEDFLATITFPPNPFRNFDNTLPTNLPLPGHHTTGRFGPAGQPLPNGNAVTGLNSYRTARLDGGLDCVTCHTLPTGAGPDGRIVGLNFQPIPPGPNGERHLMMVSVDGSTNVSIKVPQTRNDYEKTGFDMTQTRNTAGFGVLHDGSVDSLERFVAEPVFSVTSNQMVANLVAFLLAMSGSELPLGSPTNPLQLPGPSSRDSHAAVGWQTTLIDAASPAPGQLTLINNMITQANSGRVGLVVKGRVNGEQRGYRYNTADGTFQSDRAAEVVTTAALQALAAPGSELTYTVVPFVSRTRIGIDRDEDGFFDQDELDVCSDPANPAVTPNNASLTGDLDDDFDVDLNDLTQLLAHYGTTSGATPADGDGDGDGDVDLSDLSLLLPVARRFGYDVPDAGAARGRDGRSRESSTACRTPNLGVQLAVAQASLTPSVGRPRRHRRAVDPRRFAQSQVDRLDARRRKRVADSPANERQARMVAGGLWTRSRYLGIRRRPAASL
jgi:YVTN family beta-propeller protein